MLKSGQLIANQICEFCCSYDYKQLVDEVFVVSGIIKVEVSVISQAFFGSADNTYPDLDYRIYSINRPGRLLNFWTLRVGAYSRWALIRGWALIKFSPFPASEVCLFCNKTMNANNKTRRSNKASFL